MSFLRKISASLLSLFRKTDRRNAIGVPLVVFSITALLTACGGGGGSGSGSGSSGETYQVDSLHEFGVRYIKSTTAATSSISTIELTFSKDLHPLSCRRENFRLTDFNGLIPGFVSCTGSIALIKPATALEPGAQYTIRVTTDVMDSSNKHLYADHVETFTAQDRSWTTAEMVNFGGHNVNQSTPGLAVSGDGSAWAVWGQSNPGQSPVTASHYTPSTGWQPSVPIGVYGASGTLSTSNHRVVTNPRGDAVAVWQQYDNDPNHPTVWVNLYNVATGWGTPFPLSYVEKDVEPQAVIDNLGHIMIAWKRITTTPSKLMTTRYIADLAGWTGEEVLSSLDANGNVNMGIDEYGRVTVIYKQGTASINQKLVSSRFIPTTGWEAPVAISPEVIIDPTFTCAFCSQGISDFTLAINKRGSVVVTWATLDTTTFRNNLWTNIYIPSVGWGTPQIVNPSGPQASGGTFKTAIDNAGNILTVWWEYNATLGIYSIPWSNYYTPTTDWGKPNSITFLGSGFSVPISALAFNSKGRAVMVWRMGPMARASYFPNTGWTAYNTIDSTEGGYFGDAALAFDELDRAILLWSVPINGLSNSPHNAWISRFQ